MKNIQKNNIELSKQQEDTTKVSSCVMRKCCGCGETKPRTELVRIMKDFKTSEPIISPNNKQFGKSIYICKNEECLKIAKKKKRFERFFNKQLDDSFYVKIMENFYQPK